MVEEAPRTRTYLIVDSAGRSFAAIYLGAGHQGEEEVRQFLLSTQRVAAPDHCTLVEFDPEDGWQILGGGPIDEFRADADVLVLAALPPSPARGA